jgi:hypothetical protein
VVDEGEREKPLYFNRKKERKKLKNIRVNLGILAALPVYQALPVYPLAT